MQIHSAEAIIPEPSPLETGIRTAKLKRHIYPGTEQIPAELFQAGFETLRSKIHKVSKVSKAILVIGREGP
jgi:hypothetical protein